MSKVKVLGEAFGIQITRPWSNEMYEHNDKVKDIMVKSITDAIHKAFKDDDLNSLKIIGKAINGYGYANGDCFRVKQDALNGLSNVQNHWLHSDTWPDLLKASLVKPIELSMIGY